MASNDCVSADPNTKHKVKSMVLMIVNIVFWVVTSHSLVESH